MEELLRPAAAQEPRGPLHPLLRLRAASRRGMIEGEELHYFFREDADHYEECTGCTEDKDTAFGVIVGCVARCHQADTS